MSNFTNNKPIDTKLARRYLPTYQFSETHTIAAVNAGPKAILAATMHAGDQKDPVINCLQKIRELPARVFARMGKKNDLANRPIFGLSDFLLLEETDTELAFGLIGRFWRIDYGLIKVGSAAEFQAFNTPGVAKLVMTWSVLPGTDNPHAHQVLTETRVACPDLRSRLLFLPYWLAIRLASGLIRQRLLAQIKRIAEQSDQRAAFGQ